MVTRNSVNTNIVATVANERTMPLQPAFLATASSQGNVTGDGTYYNVVFTNERFDQNNDYDGTSTFTAPVTGRCSFSVICALGGYDTTQAAFDVSLGTSNRNYSYTSQCQWNIGAGDNIQGTLSMLADMDAADTAYCQFASHGGNKVMGVNTRSHFSGCLIC